MNIAQYQNEAQRTCPDLGHISYNLLHMEMGLYTEMAGELLDCYKKWMVYQKPLDMVNVSEEIADCMWYLVNEARINGYIFEEGYEPSTSWVVPAPEISLVIFEIMNFLKLRVAGNFLRYTDMVNHLYGIAVLAGVDFHQALENNINKLRIRFPEKFENELAINRNVEEERKVL